MNLSIITISKDDCDGLAASLRSAQRLREIETVEHIVVATGSSLWIEPDSSVVVLEQKESGIYPAFNEGLSAANGEWVWFLNGGDRVHEELDSEWFLQLVGSSTAEMIIGGCVYDVDDTARWHPALSRQWPLVDYWIPHPSTIVRRELFERIGPFAERFRIAGDYEWWLRSLTKDIRTDLISIPFARFASGGLSQQSDNLNLIQKEVAVAVRAHQSQLWRSVLRQNGRFFRQWANAWLSIFR